MSVTRIPQDDVIAMFIANVEKVERQNRLAPVAIEMAVTGRQCPWCSGQQEFPFYSGGEIRYETCDFCSGLGSVEV